MKFVNQILKIHAFYHFRVHVITYQDFYHSSKNSWAKKILDQKTHTAEDWVDRVTVVVTVADRELIFETLTFQSRPQSMEHRPNLRNLLVEPAAISELELKINPKTSHLSRSSFSFDFFQLPSLYLNNGKISKKF